MVWTSTSSPTTVWVPVSPGSVISETLLSQIQAEVAAAQAAAAAAAASAADAADAEADAEAALTAANAAVATSQTNATNAQTYANQAALIAGSLTPIPTGGTTDQVLAKASAADYDYYWKDDEGGSAGTVDGSGTAQKLVLWQDSNTVTDSIATQVTTAGITIAGYLGVGSGTLPTSGTIRLVDLASVYYRDTSGNSRFVFGFGREPFTPVIGEHVLYVGGPVAGSGAITEMMLNHGTRLMFRDTSGNQSLRGVEPTGGASGHISVNGWTFNGTGNAGNIVWGGAGGGGNSIGTVGTPVGTLYVGTVTATTLTGAGSGITSLNASNLASGTVNHARLGTGGGGSTKFLREDNTWQAIAGGGDALTSGTLAQFAATTSAQLAGVISDETGSGALVFANTPTLVTPVLGVATATSINKVAITAPAASATLTIADGATLTASATATVSGTNTGDQTSVTGNAGTATALQTPRTINGTSFDGTANITVAAAAGTLTGATLASGVTASSLTSVGTLSSLTMGGTLAAVDNLVTRPYFQDYAEAVNAIGNSTGTLTVDYSSGNVATATLTGNITTFSITNPPATGRAGSLTLILTQDGTGSRTVTWGSSVKWSAGTAPTLSGANKVDIINLVTTDAGTTWRATASVNHD
jgi:hypothetical protein